MDATTLGSLLLGVGAVATAVVAFVGKRGENGLGRFNSFTDQIQEERDRAADRLATAQAEIISLHKQQHDDLIEITRLQMKVNQLGGEL